MVTEAESGKAVGKLSNLQSLIELPSGIYNVTFGNAVWKSVEIRPGETTVLTPGVLAVQNAALPGHKVLDAETGVEVGTVSALQNSITVLPSTFSVTFGNALWKDIEVKLGERKLLNPGILSVLGAYTDSLWPFWIKAWRISSGTRSSIRNVLPPKLGLVNRGASMAAWMFIP